MSTPLYRQDSEFSKSDIDPIDGEKGNYNHREHVRIPHVIEEENEAETGNVGANEYEKSKHMAKIVSLGFSRSLVTSQVDRSACYMADARAKQVYLEED
jgi:hypothetical protein